MLVENSPSLKSTENKFVHSSENGYKTLSSAKNFDVQLPWPATKLHAVFDFFSFTRPSGRHISNLLWK